MGIRFLALALLASAACVSSPSVPDPGSGEPLPQVYADVLLNYTVGGEFGVCRKELPACEVPLDTPCDQAGDMPDALTVLGAPDDALFTFDRDGRLDVGIHCGAITEAGPLIIHAIGSDLMHADVFVSLDGIYFTLIGDLVGPKPDAGPGEVSFTGSFSLTTYGFHSIRYVRLFDRSAAGMSIDSIEGTWSGDPE